MPDKDILARLLEQREAMESLLNQLVADQVTETIVTLNMRFHGTDASQVDAILRVLEIGGLSGPEAAAWLFLRGVKTELARISSMASLVGLNFEISEE